MPSYFDIYVISQRRDQETIEMFLDDFLPFREESGDEFEYPQFSDNPTVTFNEEKNVISQCCNFKNSEYRLYWHASKNNKPEYAMVSFLKDGHIIFGLSTDDANPELAKVYLDMMKLKLGSEQGFIGHEATPDAFNLEEFEELIETHKTLLEDIEDIVASKERENEPTLSYDALLDTLKANGTL